MLFFLLRESLHDLDRRYAPLHQRIDAGIGVAHFRGDLDDLAIEDRDHDEQDRHDGQREQSQRRVHREQHDQHAAQQDHRREDRQDAVHDHRLNREAVGGDPVHQIADPLAAVIGQGETLQMRIKIAAQVIDHVLADPDCRVIVQQGQRAGAEMDDDDGEAGEQQQRAGRQRQELTERAGRRRGFATQHVVNDDLQRPWLQQLEAGDQENLRQRPGDLPAMRLQIGQKFPDHRLSRGRCRMADVLPQAVRGRPIGSAVRPTGRKTNSFALSSRYRQRLRRSKRKRANSKISAEPSSSIRTFLGENGMSRDR